MTSRQEVEYFKSGCKMLVTGNSHSTALWTRIGTLKRRRRRKYEEKWVKCKLLISYLAQKLLKLRCSTFYLLFVNDYFRKFHVSQFPKLKDIWLLCTYYEKVLCLSFTKKRYLNWWWQKENIIESLLRNMHFMMKKFSISNCF